MTCCESFSQETRKHRKYTRVEQCRILVLYINYYWDTPRLPTKEVGEWACHISQTLNLTSEYLLYKELGRKASVQQIRLLLVRVMKGGSLCVKYLIEVRLGRYLISQRPQERARWTTIRPQIVSEIRRSSNASYNQDEGAINNRSVIHLDISGPMISNPNTPQLQRLTVKQDLDPLAAIKEHTEIPLEQLINNKV